MILLVHTAFSKTIGRFDKYIPPLNILEVETFEIKISKTGSIKTDLVSLLEKAKLATRVLLHIQPLKTDHRFPYDRYFPTIHSFLNIDPIIKDKTFLIQPFYYHHYKTKLSDNIKNAFSDKVRLGEFREVPFEELCYLPATREESLKLLFAILFFLTEKPYEP